jgi:hypothetical protein
MKEVSMMTFRAFILGACLLSISVRAVSAVDSALTLRYQSFDSDGRARLSSSLVLRGEGGEIVGLYREDGGKEQRFELTGDAGRLEARVSGPDEGMIFSALFRTAEGRVLVKADGAAAKGWKPALGDGNTGLFFILPKLLDLRAGKSKAAYTITRGEDGKHATFLFECLGFTRILVRGEVQDVYVVRMELCDGLLHLFWPYAYHYYFRVSDLLMVRYEGPDSRRRMERIDLVSAMESRLAIR